MREERVAAEALRELKSGDVLAASTMNAIIRAVRARATTERGYGASDGRASLEPIHTKSVDIWIDAYEEIPPYSIFGVSAEASSGMPVPRMSVSASGGSPFGLYTNGHFEIAAGDTASVRPVGELGPTLVRVSGTTPGPGQPCGLKPGTFGVTGESIGLVCLSEPLDIAVLGSGAIAGDYVLVARAHELGAILGEVTQEATAYAPSTETLGRGTLKVLYRDHDTDVLYDAVDPATGSSPWEMPFFHYDEATIPVGEKVLVDATAGIGLVNSPTGSGGSGSGSGGQDWVLIRMGTGSGTSSSTLAYSGAVLANFNVNNFNVPFASGSQIYLPQYQFESSGELRLNRYRDGITAYNITPFVVPTGHIMEGVEARILTGGTGSNARSIIPGEKVYIGLRNLTQRPFADFSLTGSWVSNTVPIETWSTAAGNAGNSLIRTSIAEVIANSQIIIRTPRTSGRPYRIHATCEIEGTTWETAGAMIGAFWYITKDPSADVESNIPWGPATFGYRNGFQMSLFAQGLGNGSGDHDTDLFTFTGSGYSLGGTFNANDLDFDETSAMIGTPVTDGPDPDITGDASSGTTHTHSLSDHDHLMGAHSHELVPHHHHIEDDQLFPVRIKQGPLGLGLSAPVFMFTSSQTYLASLIMNDVIRMYVNIPSTASATGGLNVRAGITFEPLFDF